jgi:WD40 repeat protein
MPRLESRLLSTAWHPNGHSVVTGTAAGTLHAWHIANSVELLRISIGAPSKMAPRAMLFRSGL